MVLGLIAAAIITIGLCTESISREGEPDPTSFWEAWQSNGSLIFWAIVTVGTIVIVWFFQD